MAASPRTMLAPFDDAHVYGLDIETDNSDGHGLDPTRAAVTDVAVATAPDRAGRPTGTIFTVDSTDDEGAVLHAAADTLRDLHPGVIVTWNGAHFDLPFIADRAARDDLDLGLHLTPAPDLLPKYAPLPGHATEENPGGGYRGTWSGHTHLDIAPFYRDLARRHGIAWSLKPVAALLGFDPVVLDRTRLHTNTAEERRAYNLSDAHVTRLLALALRTMPDADGAAEVG